MLVKINETCSFFSGGIEFIKENDGIKTASKAAIEAVLKYEHHIKTIDSLCKKIEKMRIQAVERDEREQKLRDSLSFIRNF